MRSPSIARRATAVPRLSGEQQAALAAETATDRFRPAAEIVAWGRERFGVGDTVSGLHQVLRHLRSTPKMPRPVAEKADLDAQQERKQGGASPPCVRPA